MPLNRALTFTVVAVFTFFAALPVVSAGVLDDVSDAKAAYSLRQLDESYSGPAVTLRRGADDSTQRFGFMDDGDLAVDAIESWLDGADGYVVKWHSQLAGHPALIPPESLKAPIIAKGGSILRSETGKPEIRFPRDDGLVPASPLPQPFQHTNHSLFMVVRQGDTKSDGYVISMTGSYFPHLSHYGIQDRGPGYRVRDWNGGGGGTISAGSKSLVYSVHMNSTTVRTYDDHALMERSSGKTLKPISKSRFAVGIHTKGMKGNWNGSFSEVIITDYQPSNDAVRNISDDMAVYWGAARTDYEEGALLTQRRDYHIELYDWMENLTVDDVTLPKHDVSLDSEVAADALPDVWMQMEGLTASSVVRGEPEWYVLNASNGKGIEATGTIRFWNEPRGGGGGGNPPRAYANEPAFLYQLDIPLKNGGQGNPYYKEPAVCRRALAVAITDMNQFEENWGIPNSWGDMYGKAMLSWGETYRWCKGVLTDEQQRAYEDQIEFFLEKMAWGEYSPRGANSNMDMFAIHGAADFAAVAESESAQQDAIRGVKNYLFSYPDGKLGSKHAPLQGDGLFDPSGFIMEGGQPDVFYGGESMYHIIGAVSALQDRETGEIPQDWQFLREVLRRLQAWRTYQLFYDPDNGNYVAGAGMSGRTGAGVPAGQAGEIWKSITLGAILDEHSFKGSAPSEQKMRKKVEETMSKIDKVSQTYKGTPPKWNGWSPWAKKNPYLPAKGWHDRLSSRTEEERKPPVKQNSTYYNKLFGGYPVGNQYWSYKNTTGEREYGFFVEAQPKQGKYGGWYGGKIETFWTNTTGSVIVNRHGKTGCDRSGPDSGGSEDSTCWWNLDVKAGHHVWGRDEDGKGFTTLLLRGKNLERTSEFNDDTSPTQVTVRNVFNDGQSGKSNYTAEQSSDVLHEETVVKNTIELISDGVGVTHETSSTDDEVSEIWAAVPIYRGYSPSQGGVAPRSTAIEYWGGSAWRPLPIGEDPGTVKAEYIRLTRDLGVGDPHVYITLDQQQSVKLAPRTYKDPYQTDTRARTLHIDMLGDAETMPSRSLSYNISTDGPGLEATIPVTSFNYPSKSEKVPEGGTWAISTDTTWPAANGTVDYQYSTDYTGDEKTATWQTIATDTDGRYVGGTIPAGVRAIRAVASTDDTSATTVREVTPATTSLIARDDFESGEGPIQEHGPKVGNFSYNSIKGEVIIQNGSAKPAPYNGNWRPWGDTFSLETGKDDVVVKANVTYGGGGEGNTVHVISRAYNYLTYQNYYRAGLKRNKLRLGSQGGTAGSLDHGLQAEKPYNVTIQHIGTGATGTLYADGEKIGSIGHMETNNNGGDRQGFRVRSGGRVNEFSLYKVEEATGLKASADNDVCTFERPAAPQCADGEEPSDIEFDGDTYVWNCGQSSCQEESNFAADRSRVVDNSIQDTIIYAKAYTSTDGVTWNAVDLADEEWTGGAVSLTDVNDSYIAFYSCSWEQGWVCHDGWQVADVS